MFKIVFFFVDFSWEVCEVGDKVINIVKIY